MPGWQLGQFLRQTASKTLFYTPILLVINQAFVTQVPINGRSMQPTLNPDPTGGSRDRVLVERLSPRVYRYERGKVVLLRSPENPNVYVVKRLIALEGDWLMLPGETETITVPKGHCWVEGDNHACSEDSRTRYGPVPVALIEGSVTHIVWPPSRISKVPAQPMHSRLLAVNMKPYASDWPAHSAASIMTETEQMAGDLRERVSQVVVALAGPQGLRPTAGTALLQVWLPNDSEHGDSILSTKGAPFCLHGESDLVALFRCLSCRHHPLATQPSRHAPLDAVARVYLSGQAEAAEQVDRQAKEVYGRAHDAGMCRIARTLLLPLFDSSARQKAIGVLEVVHSHDLSVEALHARLQPALKAADLFVQESPSAMWDMQEHCVALGLPVQASTDTSSAQTALGNASTGPLQGQQMSQASEVHQLPQADMSLSSAGQMQLPEGGPQGPPQIMDLLQQQQEQQAQDARGESMRAAACLLQVAQMAAADGRQSSGDQSEAAAELIANTSHPGLTKQTSQPVSASQQDTGGLYTNGSAGVGARSSTGAQKALTMEDLQAHFGVGLKEAAKRLGVCATTLKRACRRHGIKRWPRRQLMKLSRALDGVEQVQSTGGLGRSLPAGQVLGTLYRQQQAAAVAAQQALQGGQESEDDMDEDGDGDCSGGPMRKAASAILPRSASIPQKQMQQPVSASPAGGLYDMGSWPLSLSGTPSGSMASASSNMLGLTGPNMAGLQRLLQQQGQQRLAASLGSLSNMGSLPASLSINSVLDPSKLAGEGPGSRQSSIQIRTQPQFRSDSISSSQPQQGMGGNPPPSPTPAASQQQANMAALFNPFAVARQQDPLGSSVPLPVVSMLQGQGEQDGGLAHALNAGYNPAGSVDAHLQQQHQQQLLQQRQLSAHSTTSELQLEGRQLSGQKPGMLLPMDGSLQNGVSGLELQARLNSVKQASMPGSTPVQLLMAMLGGQGMGNRMPAMLPSDSMHQALQGPTPMPGQQPSGRG